MKNFMSKLFSWKTITRTALGGLAGATALSMLSSVAGIAAIPTATAAVISTVVTVGAVGAALVGVAGAAVAVGKGLVNGVRYIFSKSYRNKVKANRQAKKNAKNKNKNKSNDKENKLSVSKEKKPNIFKRIFNKLFKNKPKDVVNAQTPSSQGAGYSDEKIRDPKEMEREKEENENSNVRETSVVKPVESLSNEEQNKENENTVQPVVEDLTIKTSKTSGKAAGFYDKFSDENKALYDDMIRKNKPGKLFEGFSADQARLLKETFANTIKEYRDIAKTRSLTDAEQKDVLGAIALRTKINSYIRKKEEAAKENAFENNGEGKKAAIETVTSRIKR